MYCGAPDFFTLDDTPKDCSNKPAYLIKFVCAHREPTFYCVECISGRLHDVGLYCPTCLTDYLPPITAYTSITAIDHKE